MDVFLNTGTAWAVSIASMSAAELSKKKAERLPGECHISRHEDSRASPPHHTFRGLLSSPADLTPAQVTTSLSRPAKRCTRSQSAGSGITEQARKPRLLSHLAVMRASHDEMLLAMLASHMGAAASGKPHRLWKSVNRATAAASTDWIAQRPVGEAATAVARSRTLCEQELWYTASRRPPASGLSLHIAAGI
ncbi:hypothetical protein OPT61_g10185 [Boeremia exigua]|uniref:Uncharacterized protein n=1 Tax=Boeremia exigua TaxID=749465 RepID=A0ACC2HQS7_9PLEO|nr:hypothetical protein OPT61_g10185 [Boeremia exigua]